jgi:hypothetical protein
VKRKKNILEEGIEVLLRKSKTGKRNPLIPYGSNHINCPVRALKKWLAVSNITQGSLFRYVDRHGNLGEKSLSGQSIANIIKRNPKRKNCLSSNGFVKICTISRVHFHVLIC